MISIISVLKIFSDCDRLNILLPYQRAYIQNNIFDPLPILAEVSGLNRYKQ